MTLQITEHERLVNFATVSHARLEALLWMTPEELIGIQEEAAAMTVEQVEAMLIELEIAA